MDWRRRIVELVLVKQKLYEVDSEQLWEYRLPSIAATEEQLLAVEARIGEPLDPAYRAFLACAGGWSAFFQSVDLFGPEDLLGGPRFVHGTEMLGFLEDSVLASSGFRRDELLPIAASPVDTDVFAMARRSTSTPGLVIWFAGYEIDRFPTFDEFFAAMVDYNRSEIDHLRSDR